MTGLVRKATLFSACGLLLAGAAMAAVPSPANSTVPCGIRVVGQSGGVTSSNHTITIVVRDLANNPVANSSVVLDFTGCNGANDPGPASVQNGANGELVDCVTQTIRAITDVTGTVNIDAQAMSSASAAGVTPGTGGCVGVFADGVLLANVHVASFDMDGGIGGQGVSIADVSVFVNYLFNCPAPPTYCQVADFDYAQDSCTENVSVADLSIMLGEFFSAASAQNDPICP